MLAGTAVSAFAAQSNPPAVPAQTAQWTPPASAPGMPAPIFLYSGSAPGALGNGEADRPRMYVFLPKKRSTSAAFLVVPGGGYQHVAIGHEGIQIALWLNAQGVPAFVLDYRVGPYRYPVEINDGRRAMRLIRQHADEYGIDPNRIGVWGSSAGGHLASSLSTHCEPTDLPPANADATDQVSCKPDFAVLEYPVISMDKTKSHAGSVLNLLGPDPDPKLVHDYSNENAVTATTPPTFLFATTRDPAVPIENALDYYRALERNHVPAEIHIYDYANHGCGLCGTIIPLSTWPALLRNWMIQHSIIPPNAPPLPLPQPNLPSWIPGLHGPGEVTEK
ncbi:alpha/beta hydrolase [Silvibacterium dinghuense]|uniref:alpha/beta hydrolase n=1 Tax=Silvibacterium dinghuense TaxID=1560006 RepID=UPI0019B1BDC9|nr:alpha/beta hydrolase [Silvibacterium dinghuense]GGH02690.1 xylanase [Silvibacterium dinghuense]